MRRYSETVKADVRRRMSPPHISLEGLAVTTHCAAPSSPLVEKVVGMERRQLSWQRGGIQIL